jgi:hypothetical protein
MMVKRTLLTLAAVAAAIGAAACKQPLDIGNFSAAGKWVGSFKRPTAGTDSVQYTFRFDLGQHQRDVTGTAVVRAGTDSLETNVTGRWNYPAVTLRLSAPEYASLTFAASFVTSDTLRGPITGSGFSSTQLTIVRQ